MKITDGKYYSILPDGRALIATPMPDNVNEEVRVFWPDRDEISADQRKKIFAINAEIAVWSANDPEYTRKNLTADFLRQNIERLQMSSLSLATSGNCDKGTASLFIDFLINFCLDNQVPTSRPLMEYTDDLDRYTYAALMHKRCLICGRKADLHHVDAVGMGFNRDTKPQLGALVMPLCREHHSEYHTIGGTAFGDKYHVKAVPMDKKIAARYRITGRAATEGGKV